MEVKSILAIICAAIALVGGIETVYQIYRLTVIDATIRGLKHPKIWGILVRKFFSSSILNGICIAVYTIIKLHLVSTRPSLFITK